MGTYNNSAAGTVNSFIYTGTTSEFNNPANFSSLTFPGATYTYAHSTAGGLVVGNNDNPVDHGGQADLPYGPGQAFLYNIAQETWTDIAYPGSKTTSAYGIWYNGGTSYTIAGGYSMGLIDTFTNQNQPIGTSYMVDYNSATGQFSHWTSFAAPFGGNVLTHFQGISSAQAGVYTLAADAVPGLTTQPLQGYLVTVIRNADGSFGTANWAAQ